LVIAGWQRDGPGIGFASRDDFGASASTNTNMTAIFGNDRVFAGECAAHRFLGRNDRFRSQKRLSQRSDPDDETKVCIDFDDWTDRIIENDRPV